MSLTEATRKSRSSLKALAMFIVVASIIIGVAILAFIVGFVVWAALGIISLILLAMFLPIRLLRLFDRRKVVVVYDPSLKGPAAEKKQHLRNLLLLAAYVIYLAIIIAGVVWTYHRFFPG